MTSSSDRQRAERVSESGPTAKCRVCHRGASEWQGAGVIRPLPAGTGGFERCGVSVVISWAVLVWVLHGS